MNKITKFLQEVRTELLKVSWPTRTQAINMTLTVLGVSIFFALYVGVIDLGLSEGIKYLSESGIIGKSSTPTSQPNTLPSDVDVQPITVPVK